MVVPNNVFAPKREQRGRISEMGKDCVMQTAASDWSLFTDDHRGASSLSIHRPGMAPFQTSSFNWWCFSQRHLDGDIVKWQEAGATW